MKRDAAVIVGIDEAGRGALAGPVVAGACVLIAALRGHPLIRDSKQLLEGEREKAYQWIISHCMYGIGIADALLVDTKGILAATEYAMQEALRAIEDMTTPTYVLVDGRDKFWFDYPHSCCIRGDESEPCIAAASIVAKVTRDRLMTEYASQFKKYDFDEHKGYGTPAHFESIRKHGPCLLHRKTFLTKIPANVSPKGKTHQKDRKAQKLAARE